MAGAGNRFLRLILTAMVPVLILGGGMTAGSAWGEPSPVQLQVLTVRKAIVPPLAHCHKVAMSLKDEGPVMEADEVLVPQEQQQK